MEAVDLKSRKKDFLGEEEISKFLKETKNTRHFKRNYLIILMLYRHGLRVSELIGLKISDVDLNASRIWINRLKNGLSVEHPMAGDELRLIKQYLKERKDSLPWLFINERELPFTRQAVNYIVKSIADKSGMYWVHPHTLRHSCGYYLANRGYDLRLIQDYLGHRDPKHTAHYTRTNSKRFEKLWR